MTEKASGEGGLGEGTPKVRPKFTVQPFSLESLFLLLDPLNDVFNFFF